MDRFAAQDEQYRESVIPTAVAARVSIEAGATFGWHRWVGERGITLGIDRFGFSAPAADIAKALGFTPEAVAKAASGLLAKT
jgi:transketolase